MLYNVSASQIALRLDDYAFYEDKIMAQDAAIVDARSTGATHYVHEVQFAPIFKAQITTEVTTEVM